MSYTIQMQSWVTVGGATSSTVVLQPEPDYLDVSAFQDLAFYVEVAEFPAGPAGFLLLQTAPVKEEDYFRDLLALNPTAGLTIDVVRWSTSLPPARWLRWRCHAKATNWTMTFRICLNANPIG